MSAMEVDSSTTPIDCVDESNDMLPPPSPTDETHEEEINGVVTLLPGEVRISKANLRNPVWLNFDKVKVNGVEKVVCIYCNKRLAGASKNGTSHLGDHYKVCPKRKVVDLRQKVLTSNFMKGEGKQKLEAYIFYQNFARRALACMIIMHEYPLSIVDHIGFRNFVHALQPTFTMVSRNTIKSDIFKIYDVEKVKTMKALEKNQGRVAVTIDMWTTSNQKRGYMVITTHFIDDSWNLQSRILRFVYVPCPHTAQALCDALMDTFLDWNIDRKLSTITVDNCSTNDAMVSLLLENFDPNCLWWSGSLFHVRCAAHILNLIVKDGLEVIKEAIEKIRDSVAFWTATPKREENFEETIRQLRIPFTKKLPLDCVTRWNSNYLMLQTAIEYKDAFSRLKHCDTQYKTVPTENDWKLAVEICGRLKVFYNVTELFSRTRYPTANLFFAKICEIKIALSEWVFCDNVVVQNMAWKMEEKYDKYWQNIHGILGVAAVLDPRYKMTLIEYYFRRIFGIEAESKIETVLKLCCDLLTEYQDRLNKGGGEPSSKVVSGVGDGDDLSDFDKFVSSRKKAKTSHVKTELDNYLEEEVLPRHPDFDILAWWKSNGLKYPTLQAIAKDALAIPVSTVASESAFSTSGRVLNPNRNRLHPKTLEALMCAQSWLTALEHEDEPLQGFGTINDDADDHDCVSSVTNVDG
ncbi:hypothetical protein RHSIM_Rhsim07G0157200 [Rhododendron simsii]|uniref:BED-type domain-containing protein n=1 Tax=Rhododendron simsii TaxID=118357 RepID=A0A834LIH8_RHOSS|nr:hypothetical protein RHSIM_Rhsim07G0157200 [Rhododendron simsii]